MPRNHRGDVDIGAAIIIAFLILWLVLGSVEEVRLWLWELVR